VHFGGENARRFPTSKCARDYSNYYVRAMRVAAQRSHQGERKLYEAVTSVRVPPLERTSPSDGRPLSLGRQQSQQLHPPPPPPPPPRPALPRPRHHHHRSARGGVAGRARASVSRQARLNAGGSQIGRRVRARQLRRGRACRAFRTQTSRRRRRERRRLTGFRAGPGGARGGAGKRRGRGPPTMLPSVTGRRFLSRKAFQVTAAPVGAGRRCERRGRCLVSGRCLGGV